MIPGLLAAAGYERSDTNKTISTINSTIGVWNNYAPLERSFTIPGTPSDTRWILVGVQALEIAAAPTTTNFASIIVNGETCSEFNAVSSQYNTDPNYRLLTAMGVIKVTSGTTGTYQVTLSATANAGIYWISFAAVDFGINPPAFTYGSNETPSGSGVLSVSDMGNKTAALVLGDWEDSANSWTTTTADADPSSEGLTRRIVEKEQSSSTTWAHCAVAMDGPPSESFPIELTPDTYTASDKAIIQYMTAHYS